MSSFSRLLFLFLVRLYQASASLWLGGACRFEPSCSEYAIEALKKLPIPQALPIIIRRIWRCRPGSSFGPDPVPVSHALACCGGHHESR